MKCICSCISCHWYALFYRHCKHCCFSIPVYLFYDIHWFSKEWWPDYILLHSIFSYYFICLTFYAIISYNTCLKFYINKYPSAFAIWFHHNKYFFKCWYTTILTIISWNSYVLYFSKRTSPYIPVYMRNSSKILIMKHYHLSIWRKLYIQFYTCYPIKLCCRSESLKCILWI